MSYSATKIECIRFAARKGGEGIGCCAIDLFQGFDNDPDAIASVKLVHGDSGTVLMYNGDAAYLGMTNRDIFLNYLRIGTFDTREMPDRIFLAAMAESQTYSEYGREWLRILKEQGFEFIRATNNSVYGGLKIFDPLEPSINCPHIVYLFGLFRNISTNKVDDPFQPPEYWTTLPEPPEQRTVWLEGKTSIMTQTETEAENEE